MTRVTRQQLHQLLNEQLQPELVQDFCPNGLQVEGKDSIGLLITGVTASQALVDVAVEQSADAILVHHGYFWKNEPAIITGMKKKRLQSLLTNNINLFAYHLPLDIHSELGNNAQLGRLLGVTSWQPLLAAQPQGVVMLGQFAEAKPLELVSRQLQLALGRDVLCHSAGEQLIHQVAWCTGGGQGYIDVAAAAGAQLFITGEVSEQTIHSSRELGIHFIAAGHHATERYGVKAVGEWLASQTGIQVKFIDIPNPA